MESNPIHDTTTLPPAIYRAVGWAVGSYQPSTDNVANSVFTTSDGVSIPARMTRGLRHHLEKKHPEYTTQPGLFRQMQRWTIYPKTEPLWFELVVMKPMANELEESASLNQFILVGKMESSGDETLKICMSA